MSNLGKITFKKDEEMFNPGYYWDSYGLDWGDHEDEDEAYREWNKKIDAFLSARFPSYTVHNLDKPGEHSFTFGDQADEDAFQLYLDDYFDI